MAKEVRCIVRPSDGCSFELDRSDAFGRRTMHEASWQLKRVQSILSTPVLKSDAPKTEPASLLEKLGVPPIDPLKRPDAFAEIRRIACRLDRSGSKSIGFVPADDRVGAIALALQVALAMDQLYGVVCNVLDLNAARPQFAHHPEFASVSPDGLGFRTVWVAERVTLSTPAPQSRRDVFAELAQVAQRAMQRYDRVLIDLTGLGYWGEQLPAYDLVDGVAVVANANRTLEADILRCVEDIPPQRCLGVILVG